APRSGPVGAAGPAGAGVLRAAAGPAGPGEAGVSGSAPRAGPVGPFRGSGRTAPARVVYAGAGAERGPEQRPGSGQGRYTLPRWISAFLFSVVCMTPSLFSCRSLCEIPRLRPTRAVSWRALSAGSGIVTCGIGRGRLAV